MNSFFSQIDDLIYSESKKYKIGYYFAAALLFSPFLLIPLVFYSMIFRYTRRYSILLCQENYPVELLTFGFLFFAVIFGIFLVIRMKTLKFQYFEIFFMIFFTFVVFLVAMEEIAWGQQFLHFETPGYLENINIQGEVTLHNVKGLQGHSDFFRFAFGAAGLIGIYFNKIKLLKNIAVPYILIGGFTVIALIGAVDVYNDYFFIHSQFDRDMRWMSEVIEMVIGIAAFFYIWLINRKVKYDNHLY